MKPWGGDSTSSRISSSIELKAISSILKFALPLGMSALVLHIYGARHSIALSALSGPVLFLAAFFLPRVSAVVTVLIFLGGVFLNQAHYLDMIRIGLFSLIIIFMPIRLASAPPLLWYVTAWAIYAICSYWNISHSDAEELHRVVTHTILELVAVLGFGLLRFSKRLCSAFGRKPTAVSATTFLVHIVTFCVLVSSLLLFEAFTSSTGLSTGEIIRQISSSWMHSINIILGLFVVPILVGSVIANRARSFLDFLLLTTSPETRLLLNNQEPPPVQEVRQVFGEIRSRFSERTQELRQSQITIRELNNRCEEIEERTKERELFAVNLERLMDLAPWGAVSCSANGLIISANDEFCRVLAVQRSQLIGQHISVLEGKHGWNREVAATLLWACRDWRQLVRHEAIRHYASAVDNYFLELILKITPSAHLANTTAMDSLKPSDVGITMYLRRHPDLRDFQLATLAPSYFEVVGTQVIDIGKQTKSQFSSIIGQVSVASQVVASIAGSEATDEVNRVLRDIEKIARQSSRDWQDLEDRLTPKKSATKRINLHIRLQHALDYLYDVLAQDERLIILLDNEDATEHRSNGARANEGFFLHANDDEITRFIAYYLFLVRNLMPKAPELFVSLGAESISQETATLLAGAKAGNYARLTLDHEGQSLTANMLTGKHHRLDATNKDSGTLEMALSLVNAQVAQLGGFISAQSTVAKGTTITIYLPLEPRSLRDASQPTHRSRKHFKHKSFNESTVPTENVLIVGTEGDAISALETMLKHLGYQTHTKDPRLIGDGNMLSVSFGGSGFDSPGTQSALSGFDQHADLVAFDLLFVNIEHAPNVTLPIVHSLEQINPHVATVLVSDSSPENDRVFADWVLLKKPFDVVSLEQAIKQALSKV